MTRQEAIQLVATRKAGILLGQIGIPRENQGRKYTINTKLVESKNFLLLPALTYFEGENAINIWIPIHVDEIQHVIDNPPAYDAEIGDMIQRIMRN